ncbi:MAG: NAD(P)-dependent alcohol dehydrogenase [Chloroflexi bacterium]|nr:NAD(P)-dependent alcohol dehydrogenase [Chloroflexota bacterium]
MRAAVCRRYGPPDVVEIVEIPKPTPADDEVLVKVCATTVTSGDWRLRTASVPPGFGIVVRLAFGIFKPRKAVLGTELAGEVEAVGTAVNGFKVGDKVFAFCGLSLGCHAEYRSIREDAAIALMPSNLTFEEAAPLSFGGTTALYFLRDQARVRPGERVLINGAPGGVGSAAVQLARHFGAEVTGVCSAANAQMVRSLGANDVVDYAREDFTQTGKTFDVILDTVGNCSFATCRTALAPEGRLLLVVASLGQTISARVRPSRSGRKVLAGVARGRAEDLRLLAELAESGAFKPVIDGTYPLDRIVDAHAHVETHHKKGNVVVSLR